MKELSIKTYLIQLFFNIVLFDLSNAIKMK